MRVTPPVEFQYFFQGRLVRELDEDLQLAVFHFMSAYSAGGFKDSLKFSHGKWNWLYGRIQNIVLSLASALFGQSLTQFKWKISKDFVLGLPFGNSFRSRPGQLK